MRGVLMGMATATATAMAMAMAVLALAFGPVQAETKKPMPADVGAGRVAWFDLTTTDLARSKEFYSGLFGWEYTAIAGTDFAVEIVSAGTAIGTLRLAEGAISAFNGVVYVQVDDVVAACKKAAELGATVVPGFPFDLPTGIGAIGLIADPAGHPLGLYSRTPIAPPSPASK